MEKNLYPLCGYEIKTPSWVQKMSEIPGTLITKSLDHIIGATPLPIRYEAQIPQRWLASDPGFYILLRNFSPNQQLDLPWILQPNQYQFRPKFPARTIESVCVILHHSDQFPTWEEIQNKFSGKTIIWTCYSMKTFPPWPREHYLNMYDALFHEGQIADSFYDLNYWQFDTLSPLHVHLLQNSSKMLNEPNECNKQVKYTKLRSTYYGEFNIV